MEASSVLELRGITKRFPGVVADDDVDFDLQRGEVHALLGENGAGKSTLMNVLYGLYKPDEGEILVNGRPASFHSAKDAISAGIGMVHQHFMLIPVMTVAENIVLGVEPTREHLLLDERVDHDRRTAAHAVDGDVQVLDRLDPWMPDLEELLVGELRLECMHKPRRGLSRRVGDDVQLDRRRLGHRR